MTDTEARRAGPAKRAQHAGEDGPAPGRRGLTMVSCSMAYPILLQRRVTRSSPTLEKAQMMAGLPGALAGCSLAGALGGDPRRIFL
jgi:hypothetical protein